MAMAGMDEKVHFVRCAKCLKILIEITDVPMYQCGGCGAILRAKYYSAPKENSTAGSLEINKPNNLPGNDSPDSGMALEGKVASSSNSEFAEVAYVEDHGKLSTLSSSSPSSEDNCSQKGESLEDVVNGTKEEAVYDAGQPALRSNAVYRGENQPDKSLKIETEKCPNVEAEKSSKNSHQGSENLMLDPKLEEVPNTDQPARGNNTEYTSKSEPDESIQADHCLNVEVENFPNLSQPESSTSMMKLEGSPESASRGVACEEDFFDRVHGESPIECLFSPGRSCQAYDGSVSSFGDISNDHFRDKYMLSTTRSFRQQRILSEGGGAFGNNKMGIHPVPKLEDLPFKSLSDRHMDKFASNREETYSRYRIRRQERGTSLDSAAFHSVHDWMDSKCPTRIASRETTNKGDSHNYENGSTSIKFDNIEQENFELSRKVDELRHQLSELYDQRERKTRSHMRNPPPQKPLFFNNNSRQESSQYPNPNLIPRPLGSYYSLRTSVPQHYQFPQMPFSGQTCCSCLHCHIEDHHLQFQQNLYHSGPCGACAYNKCSHPLNSSNLRLPVGSSGPPCFPMTQIHDHDLEKLLHKEKRQTSKRHCRPLSRGAPFVICDKCWKVLQLPADFIISRRRPQKLQCGACSKTLILSFQSSARMTQTPYKVFDPPSGIDIDAPIGHQYSDYHPGHQYSDYHPNNCFEGDPLSFSREYELSFTQSYSTEERKDREAANLTLHRLMGYSSATEILYQPSDDDQGYESSVPMRPYSYESEESQVTMNQEGGK